MKTTQNEEDRKMKQNEEKVVNSRGLFISHPVEDSDPLEKRINDAYMLRDLYRRNGKEEEAEKLQEQILEAKKALNGTPSQMNFSTPDGKMLDDAKKYGIDLTDPKVREELGRLEERRLKGESLDSPEPKSTFSWKIFFAIFSASMIYHYAIPYFKSQEEEF